MMRGGGGTREHKRSVSEQQKHTQAAAEEGYRSDASVRCTEVEFGLLVRGERQALVVRLAAQLRQDTRSHTRVLEHHDRPLLAFLPRELIAVHHGARRVIGTLLFRFRDHQSFDALILSQVIIVITRSLHITSGGPNTRMNDERGTNTVDNLCSLTRRAFTQ